MGANESKVDEKPAAAEAAVVNVVLVEYLITMTHIVLDPFSRLETRYMLYSFLVD